MRYVCLLAAALAVAGCGGNVVVDATATTGAGGGPTTASTGTGGAPLAGNFALVTTTPDPAGPCSYSEVPIPKELVFLLVSNQPLSCAQTLPAAIEDFTASMQCTGGGPFVWEVCIPISPVDLFPQTLPIDTLSAGEEHVGGFDTSCCGSSSLLGSAGAVTLMAVDGEHLSFSLAGTSAAPMCAGGVVTADGSYSVPRCL